MGTSGRHIRAVIAMTLALVLVLAKPFPLQAATSKAGSAVDRFYSQIDHPEARTYRQILQMVKPFMPQEATEHLETKLKDRLDDRFPHYQLNDKGDQLEVEIGSGRVKDLLVIHKKDQKVFASYHGVDLLWEDVLNDQVKVLRQMDSAARKPMKTSALANLLIEPARADFDWGLALGLGAIGLGIGVGAYCLSNMHTTHTVNVNVPTAYSVSVPTNYTVTGAVTVPQLNPILTRLNSGGQR